MNVFVCDAMRFTVHIVSVYAFDQSYNDNNYILINNCVYDFILPRRNAHVFHGIVNYAMLGSQ